MTGPCPGYRSWWDTAKNTILRLPLLRKFKFCRLQQMQRQALCFAVMVGLCPCFSLLPSSAFRASGEKGFAVGAFETQGASPWQTSQQTLTPLPKAPLNSKGYIADCSTNFAPPTWLRMRNNKSLWLSIKLLPNYNAGAWCKYQIPQAANMPLVALPVY